MESKENQRLMEFDEKLDDFLKGRMTTEEEQEFKTLLASNPDLKQKAIATVRMVKAMQTLGEQRDRAIINEIAESSEDKLKATAIQTSGARLRKVRIIPFRRFMISFSAAASILLCVFGGYKYYKYEQVTALGSEYLAYFPASDFSRGEEDNIASKLQIFYTNIDDGKEKKATIDELSMMWKESRSETYNDYTEYMPELGWMLANAYLCDNEKEKAIAVLNQLIADCPEDTAIGEKARELREKINKL